MEVRQQTSKTEHIKAQVRDLREELIKAINELKLLDKNLFVNQECVNAIKKSNKIDYEALLAHFRKRIREVQNEMHVNIKI